MFKLNPLPFDPEKFNEILSAESFEFHHGKHHAAYVDNLNKFMENEEVKARYGGSLETIIATSFQNAKTSDAMPDLDRKIFNNAAQHWNHTFFWDSINPVKSELSAKCAALLEKSFGSLPAFEEKFYTAGTQLFGSGWVWLVYNKATATLEIQQSVNAETPVTSKNFVPLLVVDVWEHAYYIDYRNRRVNYLEKIIQHLNWQFADENLSTI